MDNSFPTFSKHFLSIYSEIAAPGTTLATQDNKKGCDLGRTDLSRVGFGSLKRELSQPTWGESRPKQSMLKSFQKQVACRESSESPEIVIRLADGPTACEPLHEPLSEARSLEETCHAIPMACMRR